MNTLSVITTACVAFGMLLSSITEVSASPEWPYEQGEFIVRFKTGNTPDILQQSAAVRESDRQTLLKHINVWWQDMGYVVKREATPEKRIDAIRAVDETLDVVQKHILFSDEGINEIFLIQYSASIPVPEAVSLYALLEEVEYAEPNYSYDPVGI